MNKPAPPDGGLSEPKREFSDTFSGEDVVLEIWKPTRTKMRERVEAAQADQTERRRLIRSLRESASTFEKYATHELPAMTSFIRRHIQELKQAADFLGK